MLNTMPVATVVASTTPGRASRAASPAATPGKLRPIPARIECTADRGEVGNFPSAAGEPIGRASR